MLSMFGCPKYVIEKMTLVKDYSVKRTTGNIFYFNYLIKEYNRRKNLSFLKQINGKLTSK